MQRRSVLLPEPEEPMMQATSPLAHGKVDVLEHFVRAEGLAQVPDVDDAFHAQASFFDVSTRIAARLSDCEPQMT